MDSLPYTYVGIPPFITFDLFEQWLRYKRDLLNIMFRVHLLRVRKKALGEYEIINKQRSYAEVVRNN